MINIRPAASEDAAGIASVHIASWRSSYKGLVPDDVLARLSLSRREEAWVRILVNPDQVTFVAEKDGRIVGFVNGGPEREGLVQKHDGRRYDAELYAIYLLEEVKRQGIGGDLFRAVSAALNRAGFRHLLVWVLTENLPARRFYESLGGVPEFDKLITIGGKALPETAYGYDLPLGRM